MAGIEVPLEVSLNNETKLVISGNVCVSRDKLEQIFKILTLSREEGFPRDIHGRFDQSFVNWNTDIPEVNVFAEAIRNEVLGNRQELSRNGNFKIFFTHDIDWVTGREVFSYIKSFRNRDSWIPFKDAMNKNVFLDTYRKICNIEKRYGVKSWNFMLSGPHKYGRYSSRYDSKSESAMKMIKLILGYGNYIGLHGSYKAFEDDSYGEEVKRLESVVTKSIIAHRNHYLRFHPEKFWNQLENAGIRYDFSVGYSTHIGFRNGMASCYYPFNFIQERASNVVEVPLIYMDRLNHLKEQDKIYSNLIRVVEEIKEYNGCASVLFHPESFAISDNWYVFYERVIRGVVDLGADVSGNLPFNEL